MWHAFHLETGKTVSMFIWMKKKAQITWVNLSHCVHFSSCFAHYNRIKRINHPYIFKIHTNISLGLVISPHLVVRSPKTPEEVCSYQSWHLQTLQRAFYFAPPTKRKTTFPPGRVWVLKCTLMDGFIHQVRSVHSSTAELPWGTVSDSDHSASLWNHINI